jgi:hypothetical protein
MFVERVLGVFMSLKDLETVASNQIPNPKGAV